MKQATVTFNAHTRAHLQSLTADRLSYTLDGLCCGRMANMHAWRVRQKKKNYENILRVIFATGSRTSVKTKPDNDTASCYYTTVNVV